MRTGMKWLVGVAVFMYLACGYAMEKTVSPSSQHTAQTSAQVDVDLYMSSQCQHCHHADAFFQSLVTRFPWVVVHRYYINEDKAALTRFYHVLSHFNSTNFAVPTFIFCDSRWLGFASAETTGVQLEQALSFCHENLQKQAQLTPAAVRTLRQWSGTGAVDVMSDFGSGTSGFLRMVQSAFVDAYTPCSIFCFLLFLAILWLYPDDWSSRLKSGLMFIVSLGFIHFVKYVFTMMYQQLVSHSLWLSWIAGVLLALYAWNYIKQSRQSKSVTPVWWGYPVIFFTTAVVYLNQEQCNFSLGSLFQQWIVTQAFSSWVYYSYQVMYTITYLLTLLFLLVFFVVFGVHPRRIFVQAGRFILMGISLLLLVYSTGLSSSVLSIVFGLLSLGASWYLLRNSAK